MERWCEIYADDAGRLVIEDHEIASDVRVTFLRPMPFWRLTLPFRCYPAKVRVI